jgi:protein phosphatase
MPRADVDLAWKTQAGHRHQVEGRENEDAVFVTHQHALFDAVLMVADGMGGHPRPREASELAVRMARELLFDRKQLERAGGIRQALETAVGVAHRGVCALRTTASGTHGSYATGSGKAPGTTLSIAVVAEGMLHVAHVGDGSIFLMREGQIHVVAGGEERRVGNRPAQFLGQDGPPELEVRRVPLAAGDRLLLCTDGLTRYFRDAGPEALERVLGRQGVEMQTIAAQLTAHSRPDNYDDDTTVAVAAVLGFVEPSTAPPVPEKSAPTAESPALQPAYLPASGNDKGGSLSLPALFACGVVGALLVTLGFAAGRLTAPSAPAVKSGFPAVGDSRVAASPEALRKLPPGNVVLVDNLRKSVYVLSTRTAPLGTQPVPLQGFSLGADGRFQRAGQFRLDAERGVLTDGDGNKYPVDLDYTTGAIRVLRGGTVVVNSSPADATIFVDGKRMGKAPQRLTLPSGRHEIRAEGNASAAGEAWTDETPVEVIPNRSLTVTLGPQ